MSLFHIFLFLIIASATHCKKHHKKHTHHKNKGVDIGLNEDDPTPAPTDVPEVITTANPILATEKPASENGGAFESCEVEETGQGGQSLPPSGLEPPGGGHIFSPLSGGVNGYRPMTGVGYYDSNRGWGWGRDRNDRNDGRYGEPLYEERMGYGKSGWYRENGWTNNGWDRNGWERYPAGGPPVGWGNNNNNNNGWGQNGWGQNQNDGWNPNYFAPPRDRSNNREVPEYKASPPFAWGCERDIYFGEKKWSLKGRDYCKSLACRYSGKELKQASANNTNTTGYCTSVSLTNVTIGFEDTESIYNIYCKCPEIGQVNLPMCEKKLQVLFHTIPRITQMECLNNFDHCGEGKFCLLANSESTCPTSCKIEADTNYGKTIIRTNFDCCIPI